MQAKDVYMEDLNCLLQCSLAQQRQVTEMELQGIKYIFLSLPSKIKDYISVKKAWEGDGFWDMKKELLRWILDLDKGNF